MTPAPLLPPERLAKLVEDARAVWEGPIATVETYVEIAMLAIAAVREQERGAVLASPAPPAAEPAIVVRIEGEVVIARPAFQETIFSPDGTWPGAHPGQRVDVMVRALDAPAPPAARRAMPGAA